MKMFESFRAEFKPDSEVRSSKTIFSPDVELDSGLCSLLHELGGMSFNQGIYRIFPVDEVSYWSDMVIGAFPSFSGRINCFSVDWLGRIFATDSARLEDARPGVVLFEPGTAEVLEIPCNVESFHENELIQYNEEALALSFYQQWIDSGGVPPGRRQCIGYKKPLFLGGMDEVENLEISDLDVYWTLSSQMIEKTRGLPPGSIVDIANIV